MKKGLIILLIVEILLTNCIKKKFEYDIIITEIPVNLEDLNSKYDDYNSDLPFPGARQYIYFSSNRNSDGNNFDILGKSFDISYHSEEDILNISTQIIEEPFIGRKLFPLINTTSNELGPYSFSLTEDRARIYFLYANNEKGIYNIRFIYTNQSDWGTADGEEIIFGPYEINFLNSENDDLYPTLHGNSEIIFCSNRQNNSFNIYKANLSIEENFYDYFINIDSTIITLETILSSDANDKCPSINDNLLVFTSNRSGGYGGFDLYYSLFIDNQWTIPVNFGNKINSEYDEYRPITFSFWDYYDLMIFSSNRPEGKGGYDLYCVKIGNLIE
jgi:hypothetical protein